eukprot:CAMPEP_0169410864 /NCGR_PEP_ID=MMETSP1017-20121227/59999_1 /TAXON_ID=342587 /ORGANISM="Karlodinium micrum, Strain CCMP2283" /LENGTH=83 /DNA_ID=CAMNT_0009518139 /DNA_START=8 /DNA_END=263 /DNA_ORIENTATION=-
MPTNARGFTWLTVDNDDADPLLPDPKQESKAILTQVPFVPEVSLHMATVDNDDGGLPGPSQESKAILTQVPFVPEVSQLAEVE